MRRRRPEKRKILPDPIYNDLEIAKFMNYLMLDGKKGAAEHIFYNAMNYVKSRTKKERVRRFFNSPSKTHLLLWRSNPGALEVQIIKFL